MATCFDIANVETHEKTCAQLKWTHGVYLTKRPTELGFVRQRLASDRRFWVMCMVRDPRDIIVSRHDKEPDKFWAPLHFWKTEIADLRRVASHPRFLTIRYEDLVMQPDAVQDRIQARLPFLRKTAKFSEFHNFAAPSAKS
ncbi:MAG: sulfotransferase family protein, partial [Pseudomonadota bacterium]